ncbi:hypothetical protein N658DRAFT_327838 [Parathielavia hyrcaniae]|uniref:Uncharacterized protein n=1 Tax=Parathielavia hyrcaniae TaxID=113614 RepID=A0AAN6Q6Y7_9PEZI|nr:hypothetical protein N658DRAFT_327838 [Parathielavia hyrcaniae]
MGVLWGHVSYVLYLKDCCSTMQVRRARSLKKRKGKLRKEKNRKENNKEMKGEEYRPSLWFPFLDGIKMHHRGTTDHFMRESCSEVVVNYPKSHAPKPNKQACNVDIKSGSITAIKTQHGLPSPHWELSKPTTLNHQDWFRSRELLPCSPPPPFSPLLPPSPACSSV